MVGMVEFVENILENRWGEGLYRKIKVLPALEGVRPKKVCFGEKNNLTRAKVIEGGPIGHAEWNNYSLYLKFVPELCCIDFDTKNFRDTGLEFITMLREKGCYHTETVKGFHFYVIIKDLPPFKNEVNLANLEHFNNADDIDLIRNAINIWEIADRDVVGHEILEIEWSSIVKYFNPKKMNFKTPEPVAPAPVALEEHNVPLVDGVSASIPTIDESAMKELIGRLNESRRDDFTFWRNIAMGVYTNFYERGELMKGWVLLDDWSQGSPNYDRNGNMAMWDGMSNRPDNPITYKTIKKYADEDSATNIYETLYFQKGEKGMVEYINESYIYYKQASKLIYLYNDNHFLKQTKDIKTDLGKHKFMVESPNAKCRELNPGTVWTESPYRRDVECIEFDPTNTRTDIYNLWKGYNIQAHHCRDADESLCQPLLDHIKTVWCAGNQKCFEYMLHWFAWVFQRPDVKVGVCVSVKSRQGGGKGIVLDILRYIMDGDRGTEYYSQVSSMGNLIGKNACGMEGKLLVNLDEAFWGGDKEAEGSLKNLITEEHQKVEHKFVDQYQVKNTTAFIITTNNERFAGMTADDRRYFCLECDDSHLDTLSKEEKSGYFSKVAGHAFGDPTCHETCLSFAKILYGIDLTGWLPDSFPRTELAFSQIQLNWDNTTTFWYDVLNTGIFKTKDNHQWGLETFYIDEDKEMPNDVAGTVENGVATWDKLWIFKAYTDSIGKGWANKQSQFWKTTGLIFESKMTKKRPSGMDGRKYVVAFAPLPELKQQFKEHQKVTSLSIFDDEKEEITQAMVATADNLPIGVGEWQAEGG